MMPSTPPEPSGSDPRLERRYRRLLRLYPEPRRTEIGEELLGVLLDAAAPGQRHPAPGEALSLCRSAMAQRLRGARSVLRSPRWSDALAVVTVLLPAALAVRALRPGTMLIHWFQLALPDSIWPSWSSTFLAGWLAPTVWLGVTGLVLLRRHRLAGLAAVVATTIDGVHVLEAARSSSAWLAQGLIPYLAVEVLATVLLLRPRSIARGMALVTRRGLAGAVGGMSLVYVASLGILSPAPQPSGADILTLGGLAILATVAWRRRRALGGRARVRLGLTVLAIAWSTELVGGQIRKATNFDYVRGPMLLVELALCFAVPVIMVTLALTGAAVARRGLGLLSSRAVRSST